MRNAPSASRRTYGGIKADQTLFSRLSSFFLERGTQYRCSSLGKSKTSFFHTKLTGSEAPLVPPFVYTWFCFFALVLVRISKDSIFVFRDIYFIFLSALFTGPDFVYLFIEITIYSYKGIEWWKDDSRREGYMNSLILIVNQKFFVFVFTIRGLDEWFIDFWFIWV